MELKELYNNRFRNELQKRNSIWKVLCNSFFQKLIMSSSSVLDIAAGECLFINNIQASKKFAFDLNSDVVNYADKEVCVHNCSCFELKEKLKSIMWRGAGIFRSEEILENSLKELEDLKSEFHRSDKCISKQEYEFRNMLTVAEMVIMSALKRKESRGAHCRTDFSDTNEKAVHTSLTRTSLEDFKKILKKQYSANFAGFNDSDFGAAV